MFYTPSSTIVKRTFIFIGIILFVSSCSNTAVNTRLTDSNPDANLHTYKKTINFNSDAKPGPIYHLLLAEIALQKGNNARAYKEYKLLINDNAINSAAVYAIIYELSLDQKDYANSEKIASMWIKQYPTSLIAKKAIALLYVRTGKIVLLLKHLKDIEKLSNKIEDASFLKLLDYATEKSLTNDIDNLLKNPILWRESLWLKALALKQADKLTSSHKLVAAEKLIDEVIAKTTNIATDNSLNKLQLALSEDMYLAKLQLSLLKDSDFNFHYFENVIKNNPDFSSLRFYVGRQYSIFPSKANFAIAKQHLSYLFNAKNTPASVLEQSLILASSLQFDFDFDELLRNLFSSKTTPKTTPKTKLQKIKSSILQAKILQHRYKYNKAIEVLEKASIDSKNKALTYELIKIYGALNKTDKVNAIVDKLSNNNLSNVLFRVELLHIAKLYKSSNKIAKAWLKDMLPMLKKPIKAKIKEKINSLRVLLATNHFFLKEFDIMDTILEKQLQENPDSSVLANALGFMLADANMQLPKANNLIDKALNKDSVNPSFIDSKGWVAYKLNDYQTAELHLSKAYRILPNAEVGDHLAMTYWQQGKKYKAIQLWYRIWLTDKNNNFLQQSMQKTSLTIKNLRLNFHKGN